MSGTTNFKNFDVAAANIQSDATYSADATRTGGITTGEVMSSPLGNKLFYQVSTGITALMEMLANKGYSTSDASLSTLASALSVLLTPADGSLPVQLIELASGTHSETLVPYGLWQLDDRAGNIVINLAATYPGLAPGFRNTFKKVYGSANTVTINVYAGENIDGGGSSYTLTERGQAVTFVADGAADLWIESAYAGNYTS